MSLSQQSLDLLLANEKKLLEEATHVADLHRRRVKELQLEIIERDFGVKVGDFVESTEKRRSGQVYRVSRIRADYSEPWIYGNRRKKDGSFETRETGLYENWKKVEV